MISATIDRDDFLYEVHRYLEYLSTSYFRIRNFVGRFFLSGYICIYIYVFMYMYVYIKNTKVHTSYTQFTRTERHTHTHRQRYTRKKNIVLCVKRASDFLKSRRRSDFLSKDWTTRVIKSTWYFTYFMQSRHDTV